MPKTPKRAAKTTRKANKTARKGARKPARKTTKKAARRTKASKPRLANVTPAPTPGQAELTSSSP